MIWRRSLDWTEKGNLPAYLIPPAIYFTYPPPLSLGCLHFSVFTYYKNFFKLANKQENYFLAYAFNNEQKFINFKKYFNTL